MAKPLLEQVWNFRVVLRNWSTKLTARSRRQANSSGDSGWAATTMRMQCQVKCPLDESQMQANSRSRGDRDGAATASA